MGYDFKTWDEDKYGLFEPSLWQTKTSGKYIGLDHQTALGKNGITVADYYKSYAASEGSNLDSDGSTNPKDPVINPTDPVVTTEPAKPTEPITTSTKTTEPVHNDFTPGDINNDGKINIFDNIAMKRDLLKAPDAYLDSDLSIELTASAYDVTGDGKKSLDDLVLLNKFLLGYKVEFKVYGK